MNAIVDTKTEFQTQLDKDQLMKEIGHIKSALALTRADNPTRIYDFSDADSFAVKQILKDLRGIKNLVNKIEGRVEKEIGV